MILNAPMLSVVILACEKHADEILDKINRAQDGNWFVLPSASLSKTGYWPNVSHSHSGNGCAIFGFMESEVLRQRLSEFDSANIDNGVCPDCAIYEWNISSLHTSRSTRDPVCKRIVPCSQSLSQKYQERLFFFCSINCRDEFHKDPSKFVPKTPLPDYSVLETEPENKQEQGLE
jgi:YHS domain-containing protein